MSRTGGTRGWSAIVVGVALLTLAACGGTSAAETKSSDDAPEVTAESSPSAATSPIAGRWMQVHTCDQLVSGLEGAGLGEVAPAIVGDFFPDMTPEQLAAKDDVCSGAKPQRHFHFFTDDGAFGSIDQFGNQVDDGPYTVSGDTLKIGEGMSGGTWTFAIAGNRLTLMPRPTDAQIEQALADPLEFSPAGWMIAVAYPGTTWKRVPCQGWC
jgi:hypothetical protein